MNDGPTQNSLQSKGFSLSVGNSIKQAPVFEGSQQTQADPKSLMASFKASNKTSF